MTGERYALALGRLEEIPSERGLVDPAFEDFFHQGADLLLGILEGDEARSRAGEAYKETYLCPSFACERLGEDLGRLLCALLYEIRSVAGTDILSDPERALIRLELFLEVYQAFVIEYRETKGPAKARFIQKKIRQYLADYYPAELWRRLGQCIKEAPEEEAPLPPSLMTPARVLAKERISAASRETLERAAREIADAFLQERGGAGNASYARCVSCGIVCPAYLAEILPYLEAALRERGLAPVLLQRNPGLFDLTEDPLAARDREEPAFYLDHRNDSALFFDESLRTRRLQALQAALESRKEKLRDYAGSLVLALGEGEKVPSPDPAAVRPGRFQRQLLFSCLEEEEEMLRRAGAQGVRALSVFDLSGWIGSSGSN